MCVCVSFYIQPNKVKASGESDWLPLVYIVLPSGQVSWITLTTQLRQSGSWRERPSQSVITSLPHKKVVPPRPLEWKYTIWFSSVKIGFPHQAFGPQVPLKLKGRHTKQIKYTSHVGGQTKPHQHPSLCPSALPNLRNPQPWYRRKHL